MGQPGWWHPQEKLSDQVKKKNNGANINPQRFHTTNGRLEPLWFSQDDGIEQCLSRGSVPQSVVQRQWDGVGGKLAINIGPPRGNT
jgi:hypothetical protein